MINGRSSSRWGDAAALVELSVLDPVHKDVR